MLPLTFKLDGPVIIFGGGRVALRKVNYVSKFTKDIVVVAQVVSEMPDHVTINEVKVTVESVGEHIPPNASLVVAALSDTGLNHAISTVCKERGVLVNVVDDPMPSTVFFPALSKQGDLSISISTSGKCPFLARRVREELDAVAEDKAVWLEVLAPIRERLVGIEEKNKILALIYDNIDIKHLILNNDLEEAIKKAWEVYNVHCKH
jgi:siroheme synthase-like protein